MREYISGALAAAVMGSLFDPIYLAPRRMVMGSGRAGGPKPLAPNSKRAKNKAARKARKANRK